MDYESIKRLGLDHLGIDADKSFETFDPSTNNHIINVHLLKSNNYTCPLCSSNNKIIHSSKSRIINYSSFIEKNINIKLYRRVCICLNCGHYFQEPNPFTNRKSKISFSTEFQILEDLKNMNETYSSIANKYSVSPTFVMDLFDAKVDLNRLA